MKQQRWYIKRIRLNHGGYDRGGSYWGVGTPLWYCHSATKPYLDFHIRGTRDYARCAYMLVRNSSDPEHAASYVDATGKASWS